MSASFNKNARDPNKFAPLHPMYTTDFGSCSLINPMTDFEPANQDINFFRLRREKHKNVTKGINLGKAGGLRLLLDAEVCFRLYF